MRGYLRMLRSLDRRALVVPCVFFLYVAAQSGVMTFLAIYLVREQHLAAPLVGAGLLAEALTGAALAPFVGALSDRYGRRRLLLASAGLSAVVVPSFLLVHDVGTLMLWSITFGAIAGPFFPVGTSLLLDLTPPARHQSIVALNSAAFNVGYTLAIAPAGFLVELGFGWLALWSAVLFGAACVAFLVFVRGPLPRERHESSGGFVATAVHAFGDRTFVSLVLLAAPLPLSIGLLVSALPLYAADAGMQASAIGLLLSVNGLSVAVFMVPMNVRLERLGPFRPLPLACLLAAGADLLLRVPSTTGFVAAVIVFALCEVCYTAAMLAAIAKLTPPGRRGAYQGVWSMVSSFGFGSALFFAGLIRDTMGWEATWTTFAALSVVVGIALALRAEPFERMAHARTAA